MFAEDDYSSVKGPDGVKEPVLQPPETGFDYPSGSGNQSRGVKCTGVVDLFRIPKPGAAIYQAQADPRSGR
ncbi:MAG: hypothetical protein ACRDPF_26290 [Streptosporangiaceae bacterium]